MEIVKELIEKEKWLEYGNWELNEKDDEFGKWFLRSLGHLLDILCIFSCLFLSSLIMQMILEVCRDEFQKAFGLKLSSHLCYDDQIWKIIKQARQK